MGLPYITDKRGKVEFLPSGDLKINGVRMKQESLRPGDDINKQGVKFDHGKFKWSEWLGIDSFHLVPVEGVKAVATILGIGARKYAPRNWEQGMDWSRPTDAAIRHINAWWGGEDKDQDTGEHHLWHAATNIFFLIAYTAWNRGNDDRPKRPQTPAGTGNGTTTGLVPPPVRNDSSSAA